MDAQEQQFISIYQQGQALELSLIEALDKPQGDKSFNFTIMMQLVQEYCQKVKKSIHLLSDEQKILVSSSVQNICESINILEERMEIIVNQNQEKLNADKAKKKQAFNAYSKKHP